MVDLSLVIGGAAGQGLDTLGLMLAKALVRSGYHIVVTQSYQSRIRGGHNSFAIRVSPDALVAGREDHDLVVALDAETVEAHRGELAEGGLVITDASLCVVGAEGLCVPYKELGAEKYTNVGAYGVLGALLGLDDGLLEGVLDEALGRKDAALAEQNLAVMRAAAEWTRGQAKAGFALEAAEGGAGRLMMNGNEAIALGALSAGASFCSFYPMTPATSVNLNLVAQAGKLGLVVEQAEDEIAAINMALGASYAGAVAMTATSGGGFALMGEGVSLAGMTETPLVIVVAQRPGPATGLPTRTEQADLEFVLHSGHGEFPRAIFAPGDVEECFWLTRRAFELAEEFQGPMFVLTDQFLADSYRAVAPFPVEELAGVRVGADAPEGTYQRYEATESGVSPRLLPGQSEHLVVVDSDEHTPDGHLTEDLAVRVEMMDKRLRKGLGLRAAGLDPSYFGADAPDLLLVCWGSSKGAVLEAAEVLRGRGQSVGVLHFGQVWPLVGEQFLGRLEAAKRVVCVEGNATGQLAGLIRKETGFEIKERVHRYDGLPVTWEQVMRGL